MKRLITEPELLGKTTVCIDQTGVGAPVVDTFWAAGISDIRPIHITGGSEVTHEGGVYRVPKRDLVFTMVSLLQNGRLKMVKNMKFVDLILSELETFKVKVSLETGHDSYEHYRSSDKDDLVLSLSMATWSAEYDRSHTWGMWP